MTGPGQLTLSLFEPIAVKPTWEVLTYGANAHARGGRRERLFAHQHVPTRPATVRNDTVWLAMLDLAEGARRYNQGKPRRPEPRRARRRPAPTDRSAPAT